MYGPCARAAGIVIPAAPSAQWSAGVPENGSTGGLFTSSGLVSPGRDTVGAAWAVVVTAGFVVLLVGGFLAVTLLGGGGKQAHDKCAAAALDPRIA